MVSRDEKEMKIKNHASDTLLEYNTKIPQTYQLFFSFPRTAKLAVKQRHASLILKCITTFLLKR